MRAQGVPWLWVFQLIAPANKDFHQRAEGGDTTPACGEAGRY